MDTCNICGSSFKTIPAGISKGSGKPYQAFVACSKFGCKGKPGGSAPQETYVSPNMQVSPQNTNIAPNLGKNSTPTLNTDDSIRANVALKMVSELASANVIQLIDWERWANKFYHYKPSVKDDTTEAEQPVDSSTIGKDVTSDPIGESIPDEIDTSAIPF